MQKKIIVLAIAAALTPAMALADSANVTIYGTVDASYNFVQTGNAAGTSASAPYTDGMSERRVSSNQSNVGLKGSEDVGGGLSAIWQVEGTIGFGANSAINSNSGASYVGGSNTNSASAFSFDRNTYAGLASSTLGTVLVGRYDSPYKTSTRNLDVFANSIADNRSLMGGVGLSAFNLQRWFNTSTPNTSQAGFNSLAAFDGRNSQTLAYISPSFSGVTVSAGLINLTAQNVNDNNNQAKLTATSLAVAYNVAPFYAAIAHESHDIKYAANWSRPDISEKATKFGLGYAVDAFSVGLVYEKTTDDAGTSWFGSAASNLLGHSAWSLNGKFNVTSTDAIKAAYTKVGNLGDSANGNIDTGAKQISVGYDHSLSKRATVYAIYSKLSNNANAAYGLYGADGLYNNVNSVTGASPSVLSLGAKYAF